MPRRPRWSDLTLSTAPTSQWRTPMPARSRPPRAISSTATSTFGSLSTIRVATGPVMSPATVRWPSMYTPSVVVRPDVLPGQLLDVRQHPGRGRLAVGPGHRGDRDPARRPRREQHVDHRARHVARPALARRHVHPEAGRRVDLADGAADLLVRLGDVGGEEVHAAHVEPDRLDRARPPSRALSGCTRSVMSVAVPPVERLPVERRNTCSPAGGTVSRV